MNPIPGLVRVGGELLIEYIARAMEQVTSADKAYRFIQERFGVYAPRREVRAAWREWGERTFYRAAIRQLAPERRIPRAWIYEETRKLRAPYMAVGEYRVYDVEGRLVDTGQISAYFRELPTYGQIIKAFYAYEGESPKLKPGETVEYEFYSLSRRAS